MSLLNQNNKKGKKGNKNQKGNSPGGSKFINKPTNQGSFALKPHKAGGSRGN